MKLLLKHKAYPEGTIRKWADGTTRKKVGKLWVKVHAADKFINKRNKKANQYMNYALTSSLGDVIEKVFQSKHIKDFKGLTNYVGKKSYNAASNLFREIKGAVDKTDKPKDAKKFALTMIGHSLVMLHNEYWGAEKPKVTLKVKTKNGKEYYKRKPKELPVFSAKTLQQAKRKLGGWSDMKKLPSTNQLKVMLKKKSAKLVSGKPSDKLEWNVGKKLKDVVVPWRPEEKGIIVNLKQFKKVNTRNSVLAHVQVKIPYAYAPAFLTNHITSIRTRNNLMGQLERSKGYKNFLEGTKNE